MQGVLERAIEENPDLELSDSILGGFGRPDVSFYSKGDLYLIEVKGGKYGSPKVQKGVGQAFLYGLHRAKKVFLAIPRNWSSKEIVHNLSNRIRGGRVPFNLILVSNPGIEIVGEVESHIKFD